MEIHKLIKEIEYKETPEGEVLKVINHEYGSDYCFCCGTKKKKLTKHHLLPQRLKPFRNVIVPLCLECHRNIHELSGEPIGKIIKKHKILQETSVKGVYYTKEIDVINKQGVCRK